MATNELTKSSTDTQYCAICEEDIAKFLCEECGVEICARCRKGHNKLPLTKNHNVKPLRLTHRSSEEGSASYDEADMKCSEHPSTTVSMICGTCVDVYCSSCAPIHKTHEIMPLTADLTDIQEISMESLQNMILGYKDLGQRKKAIVAHSELCEEAVDSVEVARADIIDSVNQYADSLCKDIMAKKKDVESILSGPMGGVSDRLVKTDEQIYNLNMTKTSSNRHILLRGIHQSALVQKLNEKFMEKCKPYEVVPTLESMLPNIGKTTDLNQLAKTVFQMYNQGDNKSQVNLSKYALVEDILVGPKGWRICDDGGTDNIQVFFPWNHKEVLIYNLNEKSQLSILAHTFSQTNIAHVAKVSDAFYVGAYDENVYLLDDKFCLCRTKKDKYDTREYYTKTVCSYRNNCFIECCINKNKPYRMHIRMVEVKNGDFDSKDIMSFDVKIPCNQTGCLIARNRKSILVVAQEQKIYVINLSTKSTTTHDVSGQLDGRVWSLNLDVTDYILIGDDRYVHVYKLSMEYVTSIDVGGEVNGIICRGSTLLVSVKKIYKTYLQQYELGA